MSKYQGELAKLKRDVVIRLRLLFFFLHHSYEYSCKDLIFLIVQKATAAGTFAADRTKLFEGYDGGAVIYKFGILSTNIWPVKQRHTLFD